LALKGWEMQNRLTGKFLRIFEPGGPKVSRGGPEKTLGIIAVVFLLVLVYVWVYMERVSTYELSGLRKEKSLVESEARKLEITLQSMMSGEKIERAAMEKYGFIKPAAGQVYILEDEKSGFGLFAAAVKSFFTGGNNR